MITLLILLNIAHWAADYTHLSTNWMLSAKKFGKPLFPILMHALVSTALMSIILLFYVGYTEVWTCLVLLQWSTHFLFDALKGKLNVWFPKLSNPANKFFWWIMGLDQLAHQVVIIIIAYYATKI